MCMKGYIIYVYIHLSVSVYVYIYVYIYIYVYVYIYTYIYICAHVCVCVCTRGIFQVCTATLGIRNHIIGRQVLRPLQDIPRKDMADRVRKSQRNPRKD